MPLSQAPQILGIGSGRGGTCPSEEKDSQPSWGGVCRDQGTETGETGGKGGTSPRAAPSRRVLEEPRSGAQRTNVKCFPTPTDLELPLSFHVDFVVWQRRSLIHSLSQLSALGPCATPCYLALQSPLSCAGDRESSPVSTTQEPCDLE